MTELSNRAKKRIVLGIGAFLVLLGAGVFALSFVVFGGELAQLDDLTPFSAAQAKDLRVGQPILVTATISDKNPPLVHDLVLACEETQNPDDREAWQPRKQFHRPLVVADQGVEFVVTLRMACPRGSYTVIPNPESNLWRWVGLKRGDTLTVMGTITSTSPLTLRGARGFAGSVAEYRRYLSRGRWVIVPFSSICLLVGVGVIVYAARRRRQ